MNFPGKKDSKKNKTKSTHPNKHTQEISEYEEHSNNSHEVTEPWLISVLFNHGKEIKVLELKSVKNEGGVLSSVFKAKVDIDGVEEKLFIKIMPHEEG